jgi:hypothetical protein
MRQVVHQPALRYRLHPGAAERNDLPTDKVLIIAMPQGAETVGQAAGAYYSPASALAGRRGRKNRYVLSLPGRPGLPFRGGSRRPLCGTQFFRIRRGTMRDQILTDREIPILADERTDAKLYKAEYLGSGTFLISKPKRKRHKVRQSRLHNPERGSRK